MTGEGEAVGGTADGDDVGGGSVRAGMVTLGVMAGVVSGLAVGWGVAIVPFIASLLHTVIYLLVLDYQDTKTKVVISYDSRFEKPDFMMSLAEYVMGPFMIALVAFFTLGDLGVFHSVGWINGTGVFPIWLSRMRRRLTRQRAE